MPVGPAFLEGAVEAFRFSVLPGVAGFDQDVFGAQSGEGVVGHDPLHGRTVGCRSDRGPGEEHRAGRAFLIGEDHGVSQAGMVIDSDVDVVKPDPCVACCMVAGGLVRVGAPAPPSGILPSFLTSMWIMSPGASRSYLRSVALAARIRAPVTGSRSQSLGMPARARIRETVLGLTPQRTARFLGPSRCATRRARTSDTTGAGVACGQDFGLELRSSRPAQPWERYRLTQRCAHV